MFHGELKTIFEKKSIWKIFLLKVDEIFLTNPCTDESWKKFKNFVDEERKLNDNEFIKNLMSVKFDDSTNDDYYENYISKLYWHDQKFIMEDDPKKPLNYDDPLCYLQIIHELNIQKQRLHEDKLYPYIKKCVGDILLHEYLTSCLLYWKNNGGLKNIIRNIQLSIGMAIKYNDYEFATIILLNRTLQKLPLLISVTLNGKKDNLLHYYLIELTRIKKQLNQAYRNIIKSHDHDYPFQPNLPLEILNLIQPEANVCNMLLLYHYVKYHLWKLTEALTQKRFNFNDPLAIEIHFLPILYAYCQWQQLVISDDFSSRHQSMTFTQFLPKYPFHKGDFIQRDDETIKKYFRACSVALVEKTKDILVKQNYIILKVKNFCESVGICSGIKDKTLNEISYQFQPTNLPIFIDHIQVCLNSLCKNISTELKDIDGRPLEKIRKVTIVDEGKTFQFDDSDMLAIHLKKINETNLSLSIKLERIINILVQAINKIMKLPLSVALFLFFDDYVGMAPSETARTIHGLLIGFVYQLIKINDLPDYSSADQCIKNKIRAIHLTTENYTHLFDNDRTLVASIQLVGLADLANILHEYEGTLPALKESTLQTIGIGKFGK